MDIKELNGISDHKVIKRFTVLLDSERLGVTLSGKKNGVNREYVYYWKIRYKKDGIAGLYDRPHTPQNHPRKTSDTNKKKILGFVKNNGHLTYIEIMFGVKKEFGIDLHWRTIRKYCIAGGITKLKVTKSKRKEKKKIINQPTDTSKQKIISEKSWNIIKRRINDMYKMHTNTINSVKHLEGKVYLLYDKCHFHFDRNKIGLPDEEEDYKDNVLDYIRQILKEIKQQSD